MTTAITLFSGIGGVDCGLTMAGVDLIGAVEYDPVNPGYSKDCEMMHKVNFPDSKFYLQFVGEVADKLPPCDLLHASTVCKNFSVGAQFARGGITETLQDTQMARDTVTAIKTCNPSFFSLEQVAGYAKTRSLEIITETLKKGGYKITADVIDVYDYGIPQNRKRFFLLASRGKPWGFPPKQRRIGWREAIAGVDGLYKTRLTASQRKALMDWLGEGNSLDRGILINRVGTNRTIRKHDQPCWTITRSQWSDKGAVAHPGSRIRTQAINVVNSDGVWGLPIRAIGRLGGFPDWFQFGKYGGQGIGYSVPPRFIKLLVSHNLENCS